MFPADGVIRIKQAPPDFKGDKVKEMVDKHNCPILKQRVILKPKKLKLPATQNVLDDETFSDVFYDSDEDAKNAKTTDKKKAR